MSRLFALALLTALALSLIPGLITRGEGIDQYMPRIIDLARRLQALSEKGINVSSLTSELNEAVSMLQDGEVDAALNLLDRVESKVRGLEATADSYYMYSTIARYAWVATVLSTPVLFYLLFPRIYVYIWFKIRKRWIMRGSPR